MNCSLAILTALLLAPTGALAVRNPHQTQANVPVEITFTAVQIHGEPFARVILDVAFADPAGAPKVVPAFWAGGDQWKVRYASPVAGSHHYRTQCSETGDTGLHGVEGRVEVAPYTGDNPLYRHGPVQIRPRPGTFRACRRHEGGMPYTELDFSVVNPRYFDFADRRIRHLVEAGIVPVMVGGWGRPQGGGRKVGLDGFKRHWRNLVARYGAYPTVWIVGGEARDDYGPWAELAKYVRAIDPFRHPLCYHGPAHPHEAIQDNAAFDFDMVAIGHEGFTTAAKSLGLMKSCQSQLPVRPVLCGEACYEGHMQTNFQDIQRHLFWSFMLSGAAGHTYGVAEVWQASVEGDPGIDPATGRRFDCGILEAKAQPDDPAARLVEFRSDVPSPQDWVLVLENARTIGTASGASRRAAEI